MAAHVETTKEPMCSRNILEKLNHLIEEKDVGQLFKALQAESDVPEECLISALHLFLSVAEDSLQKAINLHKIAVTEEAGPITGSRRMFVDLILEKEFDDAYLLENLKKLPFALVLDLLKYVLHRMKNSDRDVDQLLRWTGITIDAHVSQFVISKDVHELLVQISQEEELHSRFVEQADKDLMPLLKQAMTKNTDRRSKAMGQYCIEVLHL